MHPTPLPHVVQQDAESNRTLSYKGDLVSAELYYKQGYNMRERIDEEIGTVDSKGGQYFLSRYN